LKSSTFRTSLYASFVLSKRSFVGILLQGTYSAAGASECTSCTAGRYASSTGQTSCVTCDAGSYAAASGASQCTVCAGGQYQHASGESSCLTCSRGYACPSGSSSMTACTSGTYAPAGSASCTACSLGTYQPNAAEPSCLACSAGTYCGTVGLDAPTGDCAAGSYAASGASACTACAVGTYQGFTARSSCDACARGEVRVERHAKILMLSFLFLLNNNGSCVLLLVRACVLRSPFLMPFFCVFSYPFRQQYQSATGQTSCSTCPSGQYCATTGLSTTSACPVGQYSASGASECTSCAAGRYQETTGQSSCAACTGGQYQGENFYRHLIASLLSTCLVSTCIAVLSAPAFVTLKPHHLFFRLCRLHRRICVCGVPCGLLLRHRRNCSVRVLQGNLLRCRCLCVHQLRRRSPPSLQRCHQL